MSGATFFVQPCPACGRAVRINLNYLGKQISCRHCRRQFTATDPENQSAAELDPVHYWINFTKLPTDYEQESPTASRFPR